MPSGPGGLFRLGDYGPEAVAGFHKLSDRDSGPYALHHTLGLRPEQASPGHHNHDGKNSKLISAGGGISALSYEFNYSPSISVYTGQSRLVTEYASTIVKCRATLGIAPTGSSAIIDILKNGASIFGATKLVIPAGSNTITQVPVTTAMAVGDYFTVDILQVGSTTPGAFLTVQIVVTIP